MKLQQILDAIDAEYPQPETLIPKYDPSSESFNLCEGCGFSWCECGFIDDEIMESTLADIQQQREEQMKVAKERQKKQKGFTILCNNCGVIVDLMKARYEGNWNRKTDTISLGIQDTGAIDEVSCICGNEIKI